MIKEPKIEEALLKGFKELYERAESKIDYLFEQFLDELELGGKFSFDVDLYNRPEITIKVKGREDFSVNFNYIKMPKEKIQRENFISAMKLFVLNLEETVETEEND